MKNGVGYWLKFAVNQNVSMSGVPRMSDSCTVKQGWNMIGTLSVPISVNQITASPGVTILSQYYGYLNGYQVADTLKPGKSYWVKVSANGKLYMNSSTQFLKQDKSLKTNLDNLNSITIKDAIGSSQTLYFGVDENLKSKIEYFELPPTAPSEVFDVRYQNNKSVVIHSVNSENVEQYPISISGVIYPINIEWNIKNASNFTYELGIIENENTSNSVPLINSGNIKINNGNVHGLVLKAGTKGIIPTEFGLSQNYPNPFNPTTKMTVSLPKNSYVKVSVYDILGREIEVLLDKAMVAGNHSIEFNLNSQKSLPSGIYFVKMAVKTSDNENLNFVRKITFLK
ncbi:MAG: T9SS type A sorting domain-containing protein [Ignavibacteria bacterium]|nr:T9SS type A sorting domain-containing protein [Ignavibacteria bacterium]